MCPVNLHGAALLCQENDDKVLLPDKKCFIYAFFGYLTFPYLVSILLQEQNCKKTFKTLILRGWNSEKCYEY